MSSQVSEVEDDLVEIEIGAAEQPVIVEEGKFAVENSQPAELPKIEEEQKIGVQHAFN